MCGGLERRIFAQPKSHFRSCRHALTVFASVELTSQQHNSFIAHCSEFFTKTVPKIFHVGINAEHAVLPFRTPNLHVDAVIGIVVANTKFNLLNTTIVNTNHMIIEVGIDYMCARSRLNIEARPSECIVMNR